MGTLHDVRYALRTMARAPAFTAVAVASLALGIGANAAIFSLFYSVVLKPLPFRDPARLIAAWDTYLPAFSKVGVSPAEIEAWRAQTDLFEQTAWYRYVSKDVTLVAPGIEALEVHATLVSSDFFSTLGIPASFGRSDGAWISDSLWRTQFAAHREVKGRVIRLNDRAFTILGVLPAKFQFPDWADVWLPPGPLLGDEATNPVRHALGFVGRLRSSVGEQQAFARLRDLSARLAAEHPKTSTGWGVRISTLQDDLTASRRPTLLMLLAAVGLVLMIACANVANLMLARATARTREIAIRAALGAGAWRIARQMLTESVVLSGIGGALGLGIAALAPVPALNSIVLLFVAAISILTGIAFGLAPVLHALRRDPQRAIKRGVGSSALVSAEFALTLILLSSAAILARSFVNLMRVDPGFDPHGVLTLRITAPPSRNAPEIFRRIEEGAREIPGVDAVAGTNALPLAASRANTSRFNVPGSALINPDALPAAQILAVSPDYFRAMRIPLRAGRAFAAHDLNQPVVIINEFMARRFWPGKNPVGEKYITGVWGPSPQSSTIIGVAGDVKQFGLDSEPSFDEYFPNVAANYLVIRTAGNPGELAAPLRRLIHQIDPELPVSEVRSMDQIAAESARSRRSVLELLAGFAALAVVLALIGMYGVMAWSVARRTREIGIRVALGANPSRVMRAVLADALRLSAIGSLIGVVGALAARKLLASLLFGVSTADPLIYAGAAALLGAAAMCACYVPALRASRVDPAVALRIE
jgi:putative ABC transport system permease protein